MPECQAGSFDLIVVGAGHAGCEAALAASRMGCETLLLNLSLDTMALMACNPSVGGLGKGQLVREIDALGGAMGKLADATCIHAKTLNASRGDAVRGTRMQNDRQAYRLAMKRLLEGQPGLHLRQGRVERLLLEGRPGGPGVRVAGVELAGGLCLRARAVVLAAGTFLDGVVHIGEWRTGAGRAGEESATELALQLRDLGFEVGRLKTGTPPRLRRASLDLSGMEEQRGDERPRPFSFDADPDAFAPAQLPCHLTWTTAATHRLLRGNIARSPLYAGAITGVGARYCPSLEDKVMRFAHKERHQVLIEPEGRDTEEVYAKGLGTCLPLELQQELVRSVPGLEHAEIMRPSYAVEYDFVQPTQLAATLETKAVGGLFLAGQVNGSSGYEEAAAQGIWAGVNAACQVQGRPPFLPDRSEAYLAVLVDDLVTRGTREPYRMFTSRAEWRLLLREDNADLRLRARGRELGLVGDDAWARFCTRRDAIEAEIRRLREARLAPSGAVNAGLAALGTAPIAEPATLWTLLRRPGIEWRGLCALHGEVPQLPEDVVFQAAVQARYEGYIGRAAAEVARFREQERRRIPTGFDYASVPGLSHEVREKLAAVRPASLGQAARVEGVTPAAVSILTVLLKGRGGA
ncbi:MAG TPA: tRNA uridine-5-carboxymethylaminomethyl(34) synthesis enzyme MnmG [bacterium]